MNKKFSTLAASLLFASAFSTVVYATGETTYRTQDVKSAQLNLVGTGWNSDYSVVKKIEAGKYYQLQVKLVKIVLVSLYWYNSAITLPVSCL